MTIDIEPEDVPLIEKVGYKIEDVYKQGTNLRIKINTPDSSDSTRVMSMGLDKIEDVEYIEDGEIVKEPRALKRVRDNIESELRQLENFSDHTFETYDHIKNTEKIVEKCEELR